MTYQSTRDYTNIDWAGLDPKTMTNAQKFYYKLITTSEVSGSSDKIYKISYAGKAKSGFSFGAFQFDMGGERGALKLKKLIGVLEQHKDQNGKPGFLLTEIKTVSTLLGKVNPTTSDIATLNASPKNANTYLQKSLQDRISDALRSPAGKVMMGELAKVELAKIGDALVAAQKAARLNPAYMKGSAADRKKTDDFINSELFAGYIADRTNQVGNISLMKDWLKGDEVRLEKTIKTGTKIETIVNTGPGLTGPVTMQAVMQFTGAWTANVADARRRLHGLGEVLGQGEAWRDTVDYWTTKTPPDLAKTGKVLVQEGDTREKIEERLGLAKDSLIRLDRVKLEEGSVISVEKYKLQGNTVPAKPKPTAPQATRTDVLDGLSVAAKAALVGGAAGDRLLQPGTTAATPWQSGLKQQYQPLLSFDPSSGKHASLAKYTLVQNADGTLVDAAKRHYDELGNPIANWQPQVVWNYTKVEGKPIIRSKTVGQQRIYYYDFSTVHNVNYVTLDTRYTPAADNGGVGLLQPGGSYISQGAAQQLYKLLKENPLPQPDDSESSPTIWYRHHYPFYPDPNRDPQLSSTKQQIASTNEEGGYVTIVEEGPGYVSVQGAPAAFVDPIILNITGGDVHTTDVKNSKVMFDMDGDGRKERTAWITKDEGFLVYDRNGNGKIDNITEMVSERMLSWAGSGYDALNAFDENKDGRIDVKDRAYGEFQVWVDKNQDGSSQTNELYGLRQLQIASLSLKTTVNGMYDNGNLLQRQSTFTRDDGRLGKMAEAALAVGEGHGGEALFVSETSTTLRRADGQVISILTGNDGHHVDMGAAGIDVVVGSGSANDYIWAGQASNAVMIATGRERLDAGYAANAVMFASSGAQLWGSRTGSTAMVITGNNNKVFARKGPTSVAITGNGNTVSGSNELGAGKLTVDAKGTSNSVEVIEGFATVIMNGDGSLLKVQRPERNDPYATLVRNGSKTAVVGKMTPLPAGRVQATMSGRNLSAQITDTNLTIAGGSSATISGSDNTITAGTAAQMNVSGSRDRIAMGAGSKLTLKGSEFAVTASGSVVMATGVTKSSISAGVALVDAGSSNAVGGKRIENRTGRNATTELTKLISAIATFNPAGGVAPTGNPTTTLQQVLQLAANVK